MNNNRKILLKTLRYSSLIFMIIFGLITIIATGDDDSPVIMKHITTSDAIVEEIEIIISESFPVEVDVVARGYTGNDGCWEISSVTTTKENNIFYIDIESKKQISPELACTANMPPFEELIPLDVYGLEAGVYEVDVNGVMGSFELYQDNIIQE